MERKLEEIRNPKNYPWIQAYWPFLITSFFLHLILAIVLFRLPLYSSPVALPPLISVKIVEEKKEIADMKQTPQIVPKENALPKVQKKKNNKKLIEKIEKPPQNELAMARIMDAPKEQPILNSPPAEVKVEVEETKAEGHNSEIMVASAVNPEVVIKKNFSPSSPISNVPQGNSQGDKSSNLAFGDRGNNFPGIGGWGGEGSLKGGGEGRVAFMENYSGEESGGSLKPSPSGTSGSPKMASLSGSGGKGSLATFLGMVRKKIEEAKRYPLQALRRNWEGKVILSFVVNQKGEIKEINIIQSSGYRILDEEAKATLRRASPLPIPPQMEGNSWQIEVPILFRLE